MRLLRDRDQALVAAPMELARSFGQRLLGLMFRRGLAPGAGLWLEPCDSIHMMFVPFSIDVAFVRRAGPLVAPGPLGEVVRVDQRVRAWIGVAWCPGATGALELEAGAAARLSLTVGDQLTLEAA